MFPDLNGQSIGLAYNAANFAALGSQGVLLLHHFGEARPADRGPARRGQDVRAPRAEGRRLRQPGARAERERERGHRNVHSNGGLKISGSRNTVSGTLTYRTGCSALVKGLTATATGLQADPLAHLTPAHFPCTFSRTGSWTLSGQLAPGVYCATGTIKLSASKVSGDVTFVANRIEISGSNVNLTPNRLGVRRLGHRHRRRRQGERQQHRRSPASSTRRTAGRSSRAPT